jgi:hypothetical protein
MASRILASRMLAPHDFTRIAAEAYRDPRTVRSCYLGRRVTSQAKAAVCAAAVKLGYPPPGSAPGSAPDPTQAKGSQTDQAGSQSHEHENEDSGQDTAHH